MFLEGSPPMVRSSVKKKNPQKTFTLRGSKFLSGLPHKLGELVRIKPKDVNMDVLTYGKLFSTVDNLIIERCTQKRVEGEKKSFAIGKDVCQQFGIYLDEKSHTRRKKMHRKHDKGHEKKRYTSVNLSPIQSKLEKLEKLARKQGFNMAAIHVSLQRELRRGRRGNGELLGLAAKGRRLPA
ncbi:hypothetical protein HHK36_019344 [Tetracentron sinense]|uniref:Uncharacterized protein n=1 Tax=Tetracentron sinense TaxID=13715 RepID=A0A835D9I9_TETSI|nr:hypothetical protein HHK36_019344 [Tetracentron sinense]